MKMLITGATGFIGKRLFNLAKEKGLDGVGISRIGSASELDIRAVDISNKDELLKLFSKERFDLVFHLAAYTPKKDDQLGVDEMYKCFDVNTVGTINLLEAGVRCGIRRFIYASSASVYPVEPKKLPVSEESVMPRNFYGESKLLAELYVDKYARENGFSYSSLRYSSVYGPGQKRKSVLPLFIDTAREGGELKVFGSGSRSQDFVFVDDVVEATLKSGLENNIGIYNIGSGQETTMLELAKNVVSVVGKGKISLIPQGTGFQDETKFRLDIGKAERELNYLPKYSLNDGLEVTYRDLGD